MPSPDLRALAADLRDVALGDDPTQPHTNKLSRLSGHLVDNAREPYEKWAAGFLTDVEGTCREAAAALDGAQEELDRKDVAMREAIWLMNNELPASAKVCLAVQFSPPDNEGTEPTTVHAVRP